MHCIVTAGPTYESLDNVRRLTNFSTGRLGCELAAFLSTKGHDVTLLIGQQATYCGERRANKVETFSTTEDLRQHLARLSHESVGALFHAAAVSDFTFGKIWLRSPQGELMEMKSGKISTRQGTLLAELIPTPKIIAELRDWFPQSQLVGWKYEVDGNRLNAIQLAQKQISDCRTDACVVNGTAYGPGFGIVIRTGDCTHFAGIPALFDRLESLLH
jgi:phosphopantothenoylcysteine decarboxylase/phosphopantothenate--cysteine ligase